MPGPSTLFRALGRLMGQGDLAGFDETPRMDTLGIMVDCSRNGVLRVEAAKRLLRHCALMGINLCMLYTEDTYQVPGEPFFGYLRGAYTQAELTELDDYAHNLGVEMMPCFQTLGPPGADSAMAGLRRRARYGQGASGRGGQNLRPHREADRRRHRRPSGRSGFTSAWTKPTASRTGQYRKRFWRQVGLRHP